MAGDVSRIKLRSVFIVLTISSVSDGSVAISLYRRLSDTGTTRYVFSVPDRHQVQIHSYQRDSMQGPVWVITSSTRIKPILVNGSLVGNKVSQRVSNQEGGLSVFSVHNLYTLGTCG